MVKSQGGSRTALGKNQNIFRKAARGSTRLWQQERTMLQKTGLTIGARHLLLSISGYISVVQEARS